ncbi:hypothetical protein [Streptomyces sp. NRRL F-2747]|uniref:hypothetical protein n=1 Tax=Streptomyces sp. NRRL F-2747 TaxID=1463843 RepID=UPI000AF4AB0D|nr:hypothetical protein [Streptomyces sp. NRRL F-2747]
MTTKPLPLLHTRDLPTTGEELRAATSTVNALTAGLGSSPSATGFLRLRRILAPDHYEPAGPREAPSLEDAFSEHDTFFGVARAHGPADLFLRALLVAEIDTALDLARAASSLSPAERSTLVGSGSALLGQRHERHGSGRLVHPPEDCTAPPADEHTAQLRWKSGHRLFFAHLQAITVTCGCAVHARTAAEQAAYLDHTVMFCTSAALAMRHAADFAPELYVRSIRPSMTPPHVGSGFSGLQTRDHYYLVQSLDSLGTRLLPDVAGGKTYRELEDALQRLYAAHVHVCRRFGGDTNVSLRMEASKEDSGTTGAERARQYAGQRLRKLGGRRPAA